MFERFTPAAREVVVRAQEEAWVLSHDFIGTEHLLIALCDERAGRAAELLAELGLERAAVRDEVVRATPAPPEGKLDAEALASIGVDLDAVRTRVEGAFGPGALDRPGRRCAGGTTPFSGRAKKSLELAVREARALGSAALRPEHLLLGLLHEGDGVAALILKAHRADLGAWRTRLRTAA
jgi:ATP-dependent Clp protease ATP-binding subunit ClpA